MPVAVNPKKSKRIPVPSVCADLKRKCDALFIRRTLYSWEEIATVSLYKILYNIGQHGLLSLSASIHHLSTCPRITHTSLNSAYTGPIQGLTGPMS